MDEILIAALSSRQLRDRKSKVSWSLLPNKFCLLVQLSLLAPSLGVFVFFIVLCFDQIKKSGPRWSSESQSRLKELNANGRLTAANIPDRTTRGHWLGVGLGVGVVRGRGLDWGNSTFIKLY